MERKRYFFKLEMEQLPDDIWQQLKSSDIVQEMKIQEKSEIVDLIDHLPKPSFDKLKHTVTAIRDEAMIKFIKEHPEECKMYLAFALSERDGWLSAEEDEAWKDL